MRWSTERTPFLHSRGEGVLERPQHPPSLVVPVGADLICSLANPLTSSPAGCGARWAEGLRGNNCICCISFCLGLGNWALLLFLSNCY